MHAFDQASPASQLPHGAQPTTAAWQFSAFDMHVDALEKACNLKPIAAA